MGKNEIRPFGWRDKLGYAMGDMGCGFSFQLVSTFMQLFYLQYIGIKATDYAVIILISKIFDAVNDVLIGNLVDTKRLGKKRQPEFAKACAGVVEPYFEELQKDVSWFCKKFDYRYKDADWKNSKDAVERAVAFLK